MRLRRAAAAQAREQCGKHPVRSPVLDPPGISICSGHHLLDAAVAIPRWPGAIFSTTPSHAFLSVRNVDWQFLTACPLRHESGHDDLTRLQIQTTAR